MKVNTRREHFQPQTENQCVQYADSTTVFVVSSAFMGISEALLKGFHRLPKVTIKAVAAVLRSNQVMLKTSKQDQDCRWPIPTSWSASSQPSLPHFPSDSTTEPTNCHDIILRSVASVHVFAFFQRREETSEAKRTSRLKKNPRTSKGCEDPRDSGP